MTLLATFRLGVKATNSKAKARGVKALGQGLDLQGQGQGLGLQGQGLDRQGQGLGPSPTYKVKAKVFTVHYITLIRAALSKSLDDDASMCSQKEENSQKASADSTVICACCTSEIPSLPASYHPFVLYVAA